jgi:hypothetical protein
MADPFAPTPSRLDLAYQFAARDRVRDELRELMSALEARFQAIEQGPAKTYAQELSALQQNARNAVTDALTPFYEDLSEIASLGGIFLATSASLVTQDVRCRGRCSQDAVRADCLHGRLRSRIPRPHPLG